MFSNLAIMKIELVLNTENATDEITGLNDYIREQNLKGIMTRVAERKPLPGEMSAGDYLPIIQCVLGSTVVAAGVKGLFDLIKNYFELQKEKIKTKAEQHKIAFNLETKDGKKINLQFSAFDEKERADFLKTIDGLIEE